jgi:hypothetical protein
MKRPTPFLRFAFCPALVAFVTIGCRGFFSTTEVALTFDNRTDAALCYYGSKEDAGTDRCLSGVKAEARTTWRPGCSYEQTETITVIIAIETGGQSIYDGDASCREWKDTSRSFVIARTPGEFVVIDPLGRVSITPID